jgi:LysR family nitrogen assimilation transcriptional regulator
MIVEFKQLQHFSKIAQVGSLTRAADTLGLTQAALSRQLAVLEAELGTELFKRNGRGLVLTEAGKRLLEHSTLILRQVAQAQRAVMGAAGTLNGTLALGLTPSLARTMVIPLIEAFKKDLPEAAMRAVDGLSNDLIELVATGKLDCAVVYNQSATDSVDLLELAQEKLYLVSGPMPPPAGLSLSGNVSLADIAKLPLVSAGRSVAVHTALAAAMAEVSAEPLVVHEIANLTAIVDLVRNGYGFTVLPLSAVHACIGDAALRLHRIDDSKLHCTLSAAMPSRALPDPLTEGALHLLRRVITKQLKTFEVDVEKAIGAG